MCSRRVDILDTHAVFFVARIATVVLAKAAPFDSFFQHVATHLVPKVSHNAKVSVAKCCIVPTTMGVGQTTRASGSQ